MAAAGAAQCVDAPAQLADADAPAPELYSPSRRGSAALLPRGQRRSRHRAARSARSRAGRPTPALRRGSAWDIAKEQHQRGSRMAEAGAGTRRACRRGQRPVGVAHVAHGAALTLTGRLDEAAAAYQKAETLEPANWELLWRLGDLAVARKNAPPQSNAIAAPPSPLRGNGNLTRAWAPSVPAGPVYPGDRLVRQDARAGAGSLARLFNLAAACLSSDGPTTRRRCCSTRSRSRPTA